MKKYFLFAAAAVALASCSSNDYVGEDESAATGQVAISFNSGAGKVTRATSNTGDAHTMLDDQFILYGYKSGTTAGSNFQPVFVNYYMWYNGSSNSTTSNTKGWEYVAAAGSTPITGVTIAANPQTIKYWDYSAADYRFVAGSPIENFTFHTSDGAAVSADVTGLAGHINPNTGTATTMSPVYIAKPKIVTTTAYNTPVTLEFVRQQALVRVGVYETIPGYDISEIHFYKQGSSSAESVTNIILQSATDDYFVGGTSAAGTITYDWTTSPASYTFAYTTDLTKAKNWYAGAMTGVKATTSNHTTVSEFYGTDSDMDTKGFFTVIPTPTATTAAPILVKCDYTLKSNDGRSTETIKVTGATAAIPAAYCKWAQNTMYTYLFKISDNTNGYTGATTNPEGLYPITFDAATIAMSDEQGTITTVSTPTFTTYQDGSVTEAGIEYSKGKAIYATVASDENGALNTLNTTAGTVGCVQVYKLSKERTEADLQVSGIIATEIVDANKVATTVPASATTVGTVTLPASQHLSFTPDAAATYYAIQYCTSAEVKYTADEAKTYNAALTGAVSTSDTNPSTSTNYTADEAATYNAALTGAVSTSTVKTPAVYAYKVVYVTK